MQHGVPAGYDRIKRVDFAQYFRRIDKAVDDPLHQRRDIDCQAALDQHGYAEQDQREQRHEHILIAVHESRTDERQNDKKGQHAADGQPPPHPPARFYRAFCLCRFISSFEHELSSPPVCDFQLSYSIAYHAAKGKDAFPALFCPPPCRPPPPNFISFQSGS